VNFNHLLIFHKVAEKQHFTRAAEELFISQPAVSKQIHELEQALGLPLFNHIGRKVYLTEAGQLLYEYASRIFTLSNEAESTLQELAGLKRGRLAIGASMTIGSYLLPQLLGRFRTLYPGIELGVDIANAEEVQEKLLENQIEIGLIESPLTHPEVIKKEWQQDELVLIDSVEQPFVRQATLTLEQLLDANPHFILRERGSGTRVVLEQALENLGLKPVKPFLEMNNLEAIKRTVSAGLGISFISEHTVQVEIKAGLLKRVPLSDFKLMRSLYLIYVKSKRLSRAAQAFIKLLDY
jgi:DNA-binding transcriptional LysR family regulator